MSGYICPSPVLGCAMRITRETICGTPLDPLAPNSRIQTAAFVSVIATPNIEASKEIMLQSACTSIETFFLTNPREKSQQLKVVLTNVNLPILSMLLDYDLLESPDNPGDFIGFCSANGLTQPNPNPKMLEVQARNANQSECGQSGAVFRHLWSQTINWVVTGAYTIDASTPFTIELSADAINNPNWCPSFPGPTFPSWVPGGGSTAITNEPTGGPPPILPAGVDADPWSLDHQAVIQAGGPYSGISEESFFDTTSWACSFVDGGS